MIDDVDLRSVPSAYIVCLFGFLRLISIVTLSFFVFFVLFYNFFSFFECSTTRTVI